MSDLIDRQAAIDALDRIFDRCEEIEAHLPEGDPDRDGYKMYPDYMTVWKYLRQLPSAQQWIPFSERLPEKSGRYLVTRGLNACGSLWNRIYIANYSDLMGIKSERIWWQGNVGKSDFERLDDVIAWMPLPEPYKGEES